MKHFKRITASLADMALRLEKLAAERETDAEIAARDLAQASEEAGQSRAVAERLRKILEG